MSAHLACEAIKVASPDFTVKNAERDLPSYGNACYAG